VPLKDVIEVVSDEKPKKYLFLFFISDFHIKVPIDLAGKII